MQMQKIQLYCATAQRQELKETGTGTGFIRVHYETVFFNVFSVFNIFIYIALSFKYKVLSKKTVRS